MNKRIKAKWVKALRGQDARKYQQGTGTLVTGSLKDPKEQKFCCLGVLADLFARENGIKWKEGEYSALRLEGAACTNVLPKHVAVWAGLQIESPTVKSSKFYQGVESLVNCNDTKRFTFSQIADLIEKDESL